jgi:hypothetical protein
MSKILIWANTYNREKLLQRLIDDVCSKKNQHEVDFFIFNDHSTQDYEEIKRHKNVKLFYTTNEHHGKEKYWDLINDGLDYIKKYKNDYDLFIKTDDDMLLCEKFFDVCLEYWKLIYHENLFTLDILSIPKQRGKNLRGENVEKIKYKDIFFYKTQWVDMNFIFNINAFEKIDYVIKNCKSGLRSSGVGLWLTTTFNKLGYEMLQTPVSLLIHSDHPSQMNLKTREKTPLITRGLE